MKFIKYGFLIILNFIRLLSLKVKMPKRISFKSLLLLPLSSTINISKGGLLSIGKNFRARRNVEINVRSEGELLIGDNVFINSGCLITCRESIEIGENTIFGPNVLIFDHDHIIDKNKGVLQNEFACKKLKIGKNVWIGAGAIILKGSEIGDNSIIGAGSVVKNTVPEGTIFLQKREAELREIK